MAVTRLWEVKTRLDHVIDYATNKIKTENPNYSEEELQALGDVLAYAKDEEKTEKQFYVTGINCNATTARNDFVKVKRNYDKLDGVQAYHGYMSFKPDEVTPELAHQMGIAFASRVWGERFQVVVTTHLNSHCLQEDICQGYFLQKIKTKNCIITATFSQFDVYFFILIYYNFIRTLGCPARSCHETTVDG